MTTRPAAVANMFYPGAASMLRDEIQSHIEKVSPGNTVPKAIIAPHAGYVYSGLTAAHAYAQLKQAHDIIKRVVLLGPCHRVAVQGLAVSDDDFFETPLGKVPLDQISIRKLLTLPQVQVFNPTHKDEHSLEVQLPFLQEVLDEFSIIPLVVGESRSQDVSEVIDYLWGNDETLFVISSDLSHYHGYETAKAIDTQTCHAIESLKPAAIGHDNACGRYAINGLLESAKKKNMKVTTLDIRNSGDTAGTKDRVVGYGAWMFAEV